MAQVASVCASGSSPLARGLRRAWRGRGRCRRIIPARAGFTCHEWHPRHHAWDHPRSRGVYLVQVCLEVGHRGIIPARAGFTLSSPWVDPATWDHPRSRGVYHRPDAGGSDGVGSSPLARGLPGPPVAHHQPSGIIPARAGFTWRGCVTTVVSSGSSPLARGLQLDQVVLFAAAGIIPARAGFTEYPRARPGSAGDHPRSRGVYKIVSPPAGLYVGSSPLARGLP